jgi:hypothetical protein
LCPDKKQGTCIPLRHRHRDRQRELWLKGLAWRGDPALSQRYPHLHKTTRIDKVNKRTSPRRSPGGCIVALLPALQDVDHSSMPALFYSFYFVALSLQLLLCCSAISSSGRGPLLNASSLLHASSRSPTCQPCHTCGCPGCSTPLSASALARFGARDESWGMEALPAAQPPSDEVRLRLGSPDSEGCRETQQAFGGAPGWGSEPSSP